MRWALFVLSFLALLAWAVPAAEAQHARPRGHGSGSRGGQQHARPAHPHSGGGGSGYHAQPRPPQTYRPPGAQRRHPVPNGRYDRYRYHDGGARHYGPHRFPRSYGGGYYGYYHGNPFYPHRRYWNGSHWFYWPFYEGPMYCGWYWLPGVREPVPVITEDGEMEWIYDGWGWVYLCLD